MAQKVLNAELYEEVLVRPSPGSPPIPVDIGSATLSVTADGVEIKNEAGNPIPISDAGGSITVDGPLTDAQLRASVVPVAPNVQQGGGAVTASTTRVTLATDGPGVAAIGTPADAAASTDTGTFSIVALIKRSLQNWTSLLAKVPTLTVTSTRLLVDGSGVTQPVSGTVATTVAVRTPTTTSVASSATSVTILAANANRRGISIANDSTSILRLSFATPATTANAFIVLPPGAFILLDQQMIVTGIIYGIWSAANGTAQVTEYV